MNDPFKLEIISPEKTFLTDNPKSVTVPAFEGDMTILINHMPLITFLRPGIIMVLGNSETEFFVEEGVVEFSNNSMTILSSTILDVKKLSQDKITKMIEDCKNQLEKGSLKDKESYMVFHKMDTLSRINL